MILFSAVKTQQRQLSRRLQRLLVRFAVECQWSVVSYHHDICAEGFGKSHAHKLTLKPSSGSASCCSPLLRDTQFQRFCHVLHYFLSSCSPLHGCAEYGLQVKSKQRSGPDLLTDSWGSSHVTRAHTSAYALFLPLPASVTFHCLSRSFSIPPSLSLTLCLSHIPIGTR